MLMDEQERVAAFEALGLMGAPVQRAFDDLAALAAQVCGAGVGMITLAYRQRHWIKARAGTDLAMIVGGEPLLTTVVEGRKALAVADCQADERYKGSTLVTAAPGARMFVGVPLTTAEGSVIGVISAMGRSPREVSSAQIGGLEALARQVICQLELQVHERREKAIEKLRAGELTLRSLYDSAPFMMGVVELTEDGDVLHISDNRQMAAFLGVTPGTTAGRVSTSLGIARPVVERWAYHFRESRMRGEPVRFEYEHAGAQGPRWLAVTVTPVPKEEGRFVYVAEDITERRRATAELRSVLAHARCILFHSIVEFREDGEQFWHTVVPDEAAAQRVLPLDVPPGKNYHDAWLASWHVRDEDAVEAASRAVFYAGGDKITNEFSCINKYGQEQWLFEDIYLERTGMRTWRAVGVCTDITDLKMASEARAKSEEQLKFALESTEEGLWDWNVLTGRIFFSPRWLEMLGYQGGEVEGSLESWRSLCHPEDVDETQRLLELMFAGKAPTFELEHRLRHKDGHWVWILGRAKAVKRDAAGKPLRVVGTNLDISRRKRAEEALRESNARVTNILESVTDAFFAFDRDWRISFVNSQAEKLVGQGRQALLGKNLWEAFPSLVGSVFDEQYHEAMRENRQVEFEAEVGARWLSVHAYPSPDGISVYLHDITERKVIESATRRASEVAQAASQAKSDFLANMSHEIRTPMTAILGFADLLAEPDASAQTRDECVGRIRRNADHLLRLINDILDLSKIEAGKMTVDPVSCSPMAVVRDVAATMRERASRKGLLLETAFEAELPPAIVTDPTRLRQILVNLVGNAVKFTDVGRVTVRVRMGFGAEVEGAAAEKILVFEVADTGIGLSEEQSARLFQPFVQADASTSRRYGGTGLGLTISRRLARMLGGDIAVESVLGRGAVFRLWLPVELPAGMPAGGGSDEEEGIDASATSHGRKALFARVLLAEDGPDNRDLVVFHLARAGAEVAVAGNGREAVEMVLAAREAGAPYDLILMDIHMPELDGFAATRALRDAGVKTPIIALTADMMEGDKATYLACGCDDFAAKPIQMANLLDMMNRHLQRTRVASRARETITADNDLRTLMERFVQRLPERVADMNAALGREDFATVSSLGHQLKGAAGGYGFPAVSAAAADVERTAKDKPQAMGVKAAVERLAEICAEAAAGLKSK